MSEMSALPWGSHWHFLSKNVSGCVGDVPFVTVDTRWRNWRYWNISLFDSWYRCWKEATAPCVSRSEILVIPTVVQLRKKVGDSHAGGNAGLSRNVWRG